MPNQSLFIRCLSALSFQQKLEPQFRGLRNSIADASRTAAIYLAWLLLPMVDSTAQEVSPVQFGSDVIDSAPLQNPDLLDPKHPAGTSDNSATAALLWLNLTQNRGAVQSLRTLQRVWRANRNDSIFEEILRQTIKLKLRSEFLSYAEIGLDQLLTNDQIALQAAVALTNRRKYKSAAAYYQKWLTINRNAPASYLKVLIHIEMGRLYYLSKNHQQAAQAFRLVIEQLDSGQLAEAQKKQLLRNSQTTYRMMAKTFLKTGDVARAEKLFAATYENDSNPIQFLSRAQIALANSDLQEAREQVIRFIAKQGNHSEAYQLLVDIIKQEIPENHESDSNIVLELEQIRATYVTGKALDDLLVSLYLKLNRRDDAVKILSHQRSDSIWRDLSNRKLLAVYATAKNLKEMTECLEIEIADHDSLVKVRKTLAEWARSPNTKFAWILPDETTQLERSKEIALCCLQLHLLSKFNQSAVSKSNETLSQAAQEAMKNLGKFESQFRSLVRRIANADDWVDRQKTWRLTTLAKECVATGRYQLAIEAFEQSLSIEARKSLTGPTRKDPFEILLAQSFCHCQLSHQAQAFALLQQAESGQKFSPTLLHFRGWLNLQFLNLDAAVVAYNAFLVKFDKAGNPVSLQHLVERAQLELAFVFFLMKKKQIAIEMINRIYDRNPQGPDLEAFRRNNQKYLDQVNKFIELENGVKHGGPFALGRD